MRDRLKTVTRAAMTMALALLCLPTLWAGQTPTPAPVAPAAGQSTPSQHNAAQQSAAKGTQSPKQQSPDLSLEPAPVLPEGNATGPLFRPPILIAPAPGPPPPLSGTARERSLKSASEVIKVILGLVFIFGLAYLAGNPRVQALENKLQIAQVVTAGLPFVFLGVIADLPGVGILSPTVLWEIRPLLALGLGWIGFTVGFRFDSKLGESITPGVSTTSLITASVPFATIVAACALLLVYAEHSPANAVFLRDAMMLATAGAMTAYNAPKMLEARGATGAAVDRVASIVTLEQLAGLVGLLVVAAYFRPHDTSIAWRLPGTAWLFITVGMGTMLGAVIWATLAKVKAGPEFTVLILGSVCFTAGMASFLRLSPLAVCFIVGTDSGEPSGHVERPDSRSPGAHGAPYLSFVPVSSRLALGRNGVARLGADGFVRDRTPARKMACSDPLPQACTGRTLARRAA